jgi:hypothetical protein
MRGEEVKEIEKLLSQDNAISHAVNKTLEQQTCQIHKDRYTIMQAIIVRGVLISGAYPRVTPHATWC